MKAAIKEIELRCAEGLSQSSHTQKVYEHSSVILKIAQAHITGNSITLADKLFGNGEIKLGVYRTHNCFNSLNIYALRVCGFKRGFSLRWLSAHNGSDGGFYFITLASTYTPDTSQNYLTTEFMVGFQRAYLLLQSSSQAQSHTLFVSQEQPIKPVELYSTQSNPTLRSEICTAPSGLNPTTKSLCPKNGLMGK